MTEIFINNQSLDLSDADIVLSFGINNLLDIQSTNGAYSNTFKIPATHKNNLILSGLNNVLSISNLPYVSQVCEIYVNGLLQLVGLAQIQSASRYEYEILIIAGNGNWIDKLQDTNLQDILFGCNYTQYWNEATVIASRFNTWQQIYNYANIDYGDVFFFPPIPQDVNWYNLHPAIYCKYLFKKIFSDIGYNIDSDWFDNNPLFEKQVIPFSAFWQRSSNPELRNYIFTEITTMKPWSLGGMEFMFDNILDKSCYDFNIPNRMVVLDSVEIDFELNLNWTEYTTGTYAPPLYPLEIAYTDPSGNPQTYFVFPLNGTTTIGSYSQTFNFTLTIGRGEVRFYNQLISIDAGTTLKIVDYRLKDDTTALEINQQYNWFELSGTLPSMAVTDFIKTIANQYGLLFQQSENTNTIKIFQFKDIVHNLSNPMDWSDKIDLSEEPIITFDTDAFAQKNYFQYAPDPADEYLSRVADLGRGSLIIDQSNLPAEVVLFESVFSPVLRKFSFNGSTGTGGTVEMAYIPVYEGEGFNNINARMAYIEFDTSALVTISGNPLISPQPNVYFDELDFKKLLPLYYPIFDQILNNLKQVNCLIRLNTMDINNVDFSRPVWIDYFGAYFYLNLIEQYNITNPQSTNVNLILLNQ